MNAQHWQEVRQWLDRMLPLAPDARAALLADVNPAIRRELESLLAAERQAEAWFPSHLPPADFFAEPQGGSVGAYRLLHRIGEGGMGVVWEAERADGLYHQHTAIKILPAALRAGDFARRFVREREILARLDHPNITRILDGGITDSGAPYLVMELVQGSPLTRAAQENGWSVDKRLSIFLEVCEAVGYAHQRLIIHRDLKPANILVTSHGTPKLLDFGLAKMLDDSQALEITQGPCAMFTPAYASPEQIAGEQLTVASDIFSLGVILHELLSGKHPFAEAASRSAVEKAIRETDAPPVPGIDRDLAVVVAKAIEKNPADRYHSMEELIRDLMNVRSGRPVSAQPATAVYRMRKFAVRNRWMVLGCATALAAIAGFATIAWMQAKTADQRYHSIRNLASTLIFEVHDAIEPLPGSTPARALVVKRGLEYLDLLAKSAGDDATLLQEIAHGYNRLAGLQGVRTQSNLGDEAGALESFQKAIDILERLHKRAPANAAVSLDLAQALANRKARKEDAESQIRRAVAIADEVASSSAPVESRARAADIRYKLAAYLASVGKRNEALAEYQKLRDAYASVYQTAQDSSNAQRLAHAEKRIGALLMVAGQLDESEAAYRRALGLEEKHSDNRPEGLLNRSFTLSDLGTLKKRRGDLVESLAFLQKAMDLRRAVYAADPRNVRARDALAAVLYRFGAVHEKLADRAGAETAYRESLALGPTTNAANSSYRLAAVLWPANPHEARAYWKRSLEFAHQLRSELDVGSAEKMKQRAPWTVLP